MTVGYSPQTDSDASLLKAMLTQLTEHGKIELVQAGALQLSKERCEHHTSQTPFISGALLPKYASAMLVQSLGE